MRLRLILAAAAAVLATAVGASVAPSPAGAAPTWAPVDQATIRPGVQLVSPSGQCTANFIYSDGTDVYIGFAAHCVSTGAATDTNGCTAGTLPLGTEVEIVGAGTTGTLAYSSWITMQSVGETDEDACAYNDLGLVQIDAADVALVNPSIPHWGGPTGVNSSGIPAGQTVYSYGNSSLRLGIENLSPKTGVSLGTSGGGWTHPTYTVSPGIPGDSGSALLDSTGRAAGVLSTLAIAPLAGSNNYSDVNSALGYMRAAHTNLDAVQVVAGTEAFNPNQLPIRL
ncbi:MAG: serine protease [Acidimicrobiales bacterium]